MSETLELPTQPQSDESADQSSEQLIIQKIHEHEGHTHHYIFGERTVFGLQEAICSCGHAIQFHPSMHDIVNGKITNRV